MANYNVGNILINIEANTKRAVSSLNELARAVGNLANVDITKFKNNLDAISKMDFSNLAKSFAPLENLNDKALSSVAKVLDRLTKFNMDNINFETIGENATKLANALDPFITKLESVKPSLEALAQAQTLSAETANLAKVEAQVDKIHAQTEKIKVQTQKENVNLEKSKVQLEKANIQLGITKQRAEEIEKSSKRWNFRNAFQTLFNIGKLYWAISYARRIGSALSKVFTMAIDFNEVLNKFQVSMGEFYDDSVKFVNQLTKAFNLSTASIMNYMSTFKNMLDALGNISGEDTYQLSQTLTRMAIDYASLFNVEIDRAMQQFQGVLSGQIRSIRTTAGYDVSESTIYNIYKELGGTKTSRQLDQTEKRLLRIIALQRQMTRTGAVNDFAKTIDNAANMLKELSETMKEAGRWFAQLMMNYLEPLIEKTLGFAMALRDVLEALNKARGYVYEDFGEGGLFGEIETSAEDAEDAVNSLKRNLLGLDKLNILGSNQSTSSGANNYDMLIKNIAKYSGTLDTISSKASAIRDKIMDWLGFTQNANGEWEQTGTKLKEIKEIVAATIGIIAAFALSKKIIDLTMAISKLGGLLNGIGAGPLMIISTLIVSIAKALKDLWDNDKFFKQDVNENLSSILTHLANIFSYVGNIYDKVTDIIAKLISPVIKVGLHWILEFVDYILDKVERSVGMINALIDRLSGKDEETVAGSLGYENVDNMIKNKGIIDAFDNWIGITEESREKSKYENDKPSFWEQLLDRLYRRLWHPRFASGGVVSKPTMAMVGEYSGASSNPEIITPENKMRGIFAEGLLPLVRAIVSGDERVVNAINDLSERPIELNGRKVSENLFDDLQDVAIRKGKTLYNV